MKRLNPVPVMFLALSLAGWYFSGMSWTFVINEVINRFIRDGVITLALLLPIAAGMGLNFAVTVGAMAAQAAFLLTVDRQISGFPGLLLITLISVVMAIMLGYLIGTVLNRVKGKEMIATILIGFLGSSLYQLLFMVGYGTIIKPHNPEIILSTGMGVRNMVDLAGFRNLMDRLWLMEVGGITIPLFMICLVLAFCLALRYIMNTKLGLQFRVVGEDLEKARMLGSDVDKVRTKAIILSTVLAALGQILFVQNIGMLNVYTGHLNHDIFSSAALLAGGATLKQAKVRHVLGGIFLFHSLFIVSPQAGQNLFGNAALGEYFRSFVAYGTIAVALMLSLKRQRNQSVRQTAAKSSIVSSETW